MDEYVMEKLFSIKDKLNKMKEDRANKQKAWRDGVLKGILEGTLSFVKKPSMINEDDDVIHILCKLGLSREGFIKLVSSNKSGFKINALDYLVGDDHESAKEMLGLSKLLKIKNSLAILSNDDYVVFLSLGDKKLYDISSDFEMYSYKYNSDFSFGDWESYKEVSDANGDILGQIKSAISKYN